MNMIFTGMRQKTIKIKLMPACRRSWWRSLVLKKYAQKLQWDRDGKCLKPGQLDGLEIRADLSQSALLITLPQAYLEYSDVTGPHLHAGMMASPVSCRLQHQRPNPTRMAAMTATTSAAMVRLALTWPWRLRADWQSDYQHTRSNDEETDNSTERNWDWSRYYAWRALPSLKAKLALGEDYLDSDIFDGFNYIGGSISTDDQMLPPNLRGYAPDISGVAHTAAKVTVSQAGRIIYETQVPAGPFRIQDLGEFNSGTLHVRIEEAGGCGWRHRFHPFP